MSLKERELKERELKLKEREKNLEHQFNVVVSDCFFAVCQVEWLVTVAQLQPRSCAIQAWDSPEDNNWFRRRII